MKVEVVQCRNGAMPGNRSPLDAQPRSGAMLVFTQVSSGARQAIASQSAERGLRPAASDRSGADRVATSPGGVSRLGGRAHQRPASFFETEPEAAQEPPDGIVADLDTALGQLLLQPRQRDVRTDLHLIQKPAPVWLQKRPTVATHLRRAYLTGPRSTLHPFHNARRCNSKSGRNRAAALSRLHRRNNTLPNVIRIRFRHPCWPPPPVWILNHNWLKRESQIDSDKN